MKLNFKKTILISAVVFLATINQLGAQTVVPVGAASTYKTIQTAYNSIKDAAVSTPITGAYIIELQADYVPTAGTTLETFPITLNAINGASAENTITIKPATGAKITLSYPNQTIIATGLSFTSTTTSLVLPDITGLVVGSYVSGPATFYSSTFKQLTAVDALTNTVTFPAGTCNATKTNATLLFGAAQTKTLILNGAKYVIIDGVSRTDENTGLTIENPNCIYAQTIHFTGTAQYNTIKNCIVRGANQTSAFGPGVGATIFFNTTNFNTITLNDVCDMNNELIPMPIAAIQVTGSGTNFENTISENNIYNISNIIASGAANTGFLSFGSPYNANSHHNYVLNNKLFWTRTAKFVSGTTIAMMGTGGGMNGLGNRFEGNTIGYANANGTGTAILEGTGASFRGVSSLKNFTCKNNTIANIEATGVNFTGFEFGTSNTSTIPVDDVCSGNTVKNIKLNQTATGALKGMIINVSNPYHSNIKNNIVSNLTAESTTATVVCTAIGIDVTGTAVAKTYNYTNNKVSSVLAGNTNSTAANVAYGLRTGVNAVDVEKNLVHNVAAVNNTTTAVIYGIQTAGGNATGTTVKNNIVRLGTDIANDAIIYGLYQAAATATTNPFKCYHNTIFVGGTAPASATKSSFAFYRTGTVPVNDVQNNIFSNQRVAGSTESHFALSVAAATDLATSDNNIYQFAGNFGAIGTVATYADLAAWKTASSKDAASQTGDPLFVDATATIPDMHLSTGTPADHNGSDLSTVVTDDFYGSTRSDLSPSDIGAVAYHFTTKVESFKNSKNIYGSKNAIFINNTKDQTVSIYSVTGKLVGSFISNSDKVSILATKGFYIVSIGKERVKVLVN